MSSNNNNNNNNNNDDDDGGNVPRGYTGVSPGMMASLLYPAPTEPSVGYNHGVGDVSSHKPADVRPYGSSIAPPREAPKK
ncbi:Uu.00g054960.m01.CDS01 [Anthostomella pinea]|uniref:Uu.00g054960.m01.CDS01 n=1 Tax=Anthostomella pinea TaxID=933095 RepID=A0AAI8VWQ9_9PEZI|nr:Uu.00g054960.m01.CDS01 [Anthostomella pinea]